MTWRALVCAWCGSCAPEAAAPPPGLGDPIAGLSAGAQGNFFLGKALFERLATQDEGLGPLFNAERCSSCHNEPASGGGGTRVLVVKATAFRDGRCDLLEDEGGDNIQQRATDLYRALGGGPEEIPAAATDTARVIAPPLWGAGLLEAIPLSALLALEDPLDADGDGISGRLPTLPDGRRARFGRKGEAATVEDFVDAALRFELGFTTPAHPKDAGRNGEESPVGADPMADPEIDATTLGLIATYIRLLAPPSPKAVESTAELEEAEQGLALFEQIGCASCHSPAFRTRQAPETALGNRDIAPYSDLLLHDLGPELADTCGPDAAGGELRTAPLWGLRYRTRLLHDGRALTPAQAIEMHGGEAEAARASFSALPEQARRALLSFLATL